MTYKAVLDRLLEIASDETGVPVCLLKSKSRRHEITAAREIFCYSAKVYGFTSREISEVINQDSSTVRAAALQGEYLLNQNIKSTLISRGQQVRINQRYVDFEKEAML